MHMPGLVTLAAALWAAAQPGWGAEAVRIVEDGTPRAVVVVPVGCDQQTRDAARLLVEYVEKASGAVLPIADESSPAAGAQPVTIHVGPCNQTKTLDLKLDGLDGDGFVIRAVDPGHVAICGPTPFGTEFGVCEFLERYVGVRWLMPGDDGEDVPQAKTIDVPLEEVRQEPAFFSRQFSGLNNAVQLAWGRHNRMHGRVQFHHNLHRLIPPETYAKTHPEFFPIRNGERYFPPDNQTHGWQPCFSAEGLVDEAVKNICRYFDEHPDATSYSLGVIDSSGHCECEACRAQDPKEPNFLGRRDVSDRYYGWCNRVVEGVLEKHPDKHFGCLAYSEVAQPPSRVKVHPRIIPYMTYDRMKWIDAGLREEGRRMTEWWHRVSPALGWYDYIYGSPYCVPRVWFHRMAEYYRFGHDHGVRALYAEAYPNWGEGPKLYVSLKLQWNPNRDVDELLREWYVRAVGEAAADDLAAYYAHWEDFWTRRILDSDWFTQRGQYLRFNDPSYLADVTEEDIAESRRLLEQVVAKAATPKQKARARLLLRAFEYYEASAIAYRGSIEAAKVVLHSEDDALRTVDGAVRCLQMAAKRQRLVTEEFVKDPVLVHPIDFDRYPQLRGDDWGAALFWRVFDWADRSQKVRRRLAELAGSDEQNVRLQAKTMLTLLDERSEPVSKNPSFESPDGNWPAEWSRWIKWGTGTKTVSPAAAHTGKLGVLCTGMKRGGPHQVVEVTPGRYAAVALVRVPRKPAGSVTVTLSITPLDEDGANLPDISATATPRPGQWTRLAAAGEIPAAIRGKPVKRARLIVIVDGLEPTDEVHIDDTALYRID